MKISDLIAEGANVYVTVSVADLKTFMEDVAEMMENQRKAINEYDGTLSQKEVCDYLGVSKSTLWRWEKIGYLVPCYKFGARPMYRKSTVENLKHGHIDGIREKDS